MVSFAAPTQRRLWPFAGLQAARRASADNRLIRQRRAYLDGLASWFGLSAFNPHRRRHPEHAPPRAPRPCRLTGETLGTRGAGTVAGYAKTSETRHPSGARGRRGGRTLTMGTATEAGGIDEVGGGQRGQAGSPRLEPGQFGPAADDPSSLASQRSTQHLCRRYRPHRRARTRRSVRRTGRTGTAPPDGRPARHGRRRAEPARIPVSSARRLRADP
jgi:hypothetical protein